MATLIISAEREMVFCEEERSFTGNLVCHYSLELPSAFLPVARYFLGDFVALASGVAALTSGIILEHQTRSAHRSAGSARPVRCSKFRCAADRMFQCKNSAVVFCELGLHTVQCALRRIGKAVSANNS